MIETLSALMMAVLGVADDNPIYFIAAGLFAIAANIGNLRGIDNNETDQH